MTTTLHFARLIIDLADSDLGPGWRSVEIDVDPSPQFETEEQIREAAARHFGVPMHQVGPIEWVQDDA